ncbi:hypothetical protein [Streptomyces sp. NPDC001530]|uniref:hypothetical protein n=1 Tax=Streptomyces sp. NPDC001530 TaxID=3364582 RepID=UPI00369C6328
MKPRLPNTPDISIDGVRGHELLAAVPVIAAGMLFFFPLETPASRRMLAMRPRGALDAEVTLG